MSVYFSLLYRYFFWVVACFFYTNAFAQTPTDSVLRLSIEKYLLSQKPESSNAILQLSSFSKRTERAWETPANMAVISASDLQQLGTSNIAEALRLVPQLVVKQLTNDIFAVQNSNFSVNGISEMQTSSFKLTIDNIPFNDALDGQIFWESLPIQMQQIERIEVIFSPMSANFGANSANGIINIVTKTLDNDNIRGKANITYGNLGTHRYSGSIDIGFHKNIKFGIGGNYNYAYRFDDKAYVYQLNRFTDADSLLFFQENVRLSNIRSLKALESYGVNAQLRFLPTKNIDILVFGNWNSSSTQAGFRKIGQFSQQTRLSEGQQAGIKADIFGVSITTSYRFGQKNYALGYASQSYQWADMFGNVDYERLFFEKLNVSVGSEINYQYIKPVLDETDSIKTAYFSDKKAQLLKGFYLKADFKHKNIRLGTHIRLDKYEFPNTTTFNYYSFFTWKFSKNGLFRLNYSTGNWGNYFRFFYDQSSEKILDLTANTRQFVQTNAATNPTLDLASVQSLEAGIRRQGELIGFDLSFFYKNNHNFILSTKNLSANQNNQTFINSYINQAAWQQQGVSLNMRITASNWLIHSFFTYQKNQNEYAALFPKWYGGLNLSYSAYFNKININLHSYFWENHSFDREGTKFEIPFQVASSARLSYKIWNEQSIFLSYRSFLQQNVWEYPFADQTLAQYLVGLQLSL